MNRLFIVLACFTAILFSPGSGKSYAATIHMERVNPMYRDLWEKRKVLPQARRSVQAVRVCYSFEEVKDVVRLSFENRETTFSFEMVYDFDFGDLGETCDADSPCDPGDPGYQKGILNRAFDEVLWADDYLAYNFVRYGISWSGLNGDATVTYDPVTYLTTYDNELYVNNRIAAILPVIISDDMTDVEKEKAIHNWIVLNVAYDTSSEPQYSAYAALADGITVCQGYSLLNFKMLGEVGITSRIVASNAMNHAWNMTRVCGHWYHEDLTWDDPIPDDPDTIRHDYFNLSDVQMLDKDPERADWKTDTLPPPPVAPDPYVEGICVILGDFDGNNMLDLADLVLVLKVCTGFSTTTIHLDADTNNDKVIDMIDALYIIETISGLRLE